MISESTSPVLVFQVSTTAPCLCSAGDQVHGFVRVRLASSSAEQRSHPTSPSSWAGLENRLGLSWNGFNGAQDLCVISYHPEICFLGAGALHTLRVECESCAFPCPH